MQGKTLKKKHVAMKVFKTTDLFRSGDFGFTEFRIPALGLATDGTVYAAIAGRMRSGDDWGESAIFVKRSQDGGTTWENRARIDLAFLKLADTCLPDGGLTIEEALKRKVYVAPGAAQPGGKTIDNPTFITDHQRGRTFLLLQLGYRRAFIWDVASDEPPRDITATFDRFRPEYPWKVLAMGPGHGIQLANGRLLVSVWLSDSSAGDHRHSCVSTIYSDDGGQTWERGAIACAHPEPINPSEAVLIELSDGRVMLNVRDESGLSRRRCLVSADGISGWQDLGARGDLFCPVCHASLIRLPGGKRPLLFVNPDSSADAKSLWGTAMLTRRNVTAKLSYDDGLSWPIQRVLDDGPISAYSDLAVLADGTILCLYERGTGVTQAVRLLRFTEEWIHE
jgi:sialidase-1